MNKKELRSHYAERRKALSSSQISQYNLAIANNCLSLPIWDKQFYHIFLSIPHKNEVDTGYILSILQGKDKHIVVPRMGNNNQLDHFLLTDATTIRPNSWGVPEPEDGISISPDKIEVIFIPLLAYDFQGNRVGYGKGYYDTFLSACNPSTIKIGLSFFGPEPKISDIYPGDIPLDYCISPEKTYQF